MSLRPIALTAGEPAGVAPEITAAAWKALRHEVVFFLVGDPGHVTNAPTQAISVPAQAAEAMSEALPVLPHSFPAPNVPGTPDPENAPQVMASIARAVDLVQSGLAGAICTNPIHKKALQDGAGFAFPGHTEYLAHLADIDQVVMMLAAPALKVVPATIHIPVADVPAQLTSELLEGVLTITQTAMQRDFGLKRPRIAVAGLNPHAGEGGAMGREEIEIIAPLLDKLRARGMEILGPMSADTMFHPAARARYDVAVAMYHDQALIPLKTIDFDGGVNVTLGLPFVRTSPDHGTALDIAGQGKANPASLIAALRLAAQMAEARG